MDSREILKEILIRTKEDNKKILKEKSKVSSEWIRMHDEMVQGVILEIPMGTCDEMLKTLGVQIRTIVAKAHVEKFMTNILNSYMGTKQ